MLQTKTDILYSLGADVSTIALKIQSEASTTNDDDLNKEEKDEKEFTEESSHDTNEQVENATKGKIIEVTIPGFGPHESILIDPETFNPEEKSDKSASEAKEVTPDISLLNDVYGEKEESIVNDSREENSNSAQGSKLLMNRKSFLTDSSTNQSEIDDSIEDRSFVLPGNQTAAESTSSGKSKKHQFLRLKNERVKHNEKDLASVASYVYILSGQKLFKNAKNCPFWRVF